MNKKNAPLVQFRACHAACVCASTSSCPLDERMSRLGSLTCITGAIFLAISTFPPLRSSPTIQWPIRVVPAANVVKTNPSGSVSVGRMMVRRYHCRKEGDIQLFPNCTLWEGFPYWEETKIDILLAPKEERGDVS